MKRKTKYSNVEGYLRRAKELSNTKNPENIIKHIAFQEFPQAYDIPETITEIETGRIRELNSIKAPYFELFQKITLARLHEQNHNFDNARKIIEELLHSNLQVLQNEETIKESIRPLIITLIREYYLIALRGDTYNRRHNKKLKHLHEFLVSSDRFIVILKNLQVECRIFLLYLVNYIFFASFKSKNYKRCTDLLVLIEKEKWFPISLLNRIERSQAVTFMYFLGRIKVMHLQYSEAAAAFHYSFLHCKSNSKNKRIILKFLVPIKMSLGVLPPLHLLHKYDLEFYIPLIEAFKIGDVKSFNRILEENQSQYIADGTLLIIESLSLHVYTKFLRRIHALGARATDDAKNGKIAFANIVVAFRTQDPNLDDEEVICIVGNLICSEYIHAVITNLRAKHDPKTTIPVLIWKDNPFPKKNAGAVNYY